MLERSNYMLTLLQILNEADTAEGAIELVIKVYGESIMPGWRPTALYTDDRRCVEFTDNLGENHPEELVLNKDARLVGIDHLMTSADAPYIGNRCPNT
ncbi:MAG TPA: hypothetical protein QF873_00600 [Patescibacteria group bacterium]|nr:hypothetical protein [Patescibacteria group bacterium]